MSLREEIRLAVREAVVGRLPVLLTYRMAARELSIGLTKLRQLVDGGELRTRLVGAQKMIPSSEVLKFARDRARPRDVPMSEGDKVRAQLRTRAIERRRR